MMMQRVASAHILPKTQEQVIHKRESFALFSKQNKRIFEHLHSSKKQLSTLRKTSATFKPFQTQHALAFCSRMMSSQALRAVREPYNSYFDKFQQQPFTQSCNKRSPIYQKYSPLEIIQTKYKYKYNSSSLSKRKTLSIHKNEAPFKRNFLRKGSSINRSVILNLLRSKIAYKAIGSVFNYSNAKGNQQLLEAMKKQIPMALRDVVGGQQMIRMTHILTGENFKCVNLTQKLNHILAARVISSPCLEDGERDTITLKSIKRW